MLESRFRVTPTWLRRSFVVPLLNGSTRMEIVLQDPIGRAIDLYGAYKDLGDASFQAVLRSGAMVIAT
jgi:hypothetical protein